MATKLKLPSLAAFKALPLRKRTLLFRRWAAAQPARKTYDPDDNYDCALCQFGAAISSTQANAGGKYFRIGNDHVQVLCEKPGEEGRIIQCDRQVDSSTFRALAKRLSAHLNSTK